MTHASVASPAPRTRGFRILRWVLAALLAVGMTGGATAVYAAAPTEEAPAEDTSVSWSARPADTSEGTGRPNFAYDLFPGATVSDGILVTNRGANTITLDVYAADGFLTADGSLDLLAGGQESTELGSWVVLGLDEITLASGESIEVPFDVTVPSTAQPGDYAAGVVASMSVESDSGVITERRLGSRMHVRVAGDIVPGLTVTGASIEYHGTLNPFAAGAATITFTLANTGNARVDPSGSVDIAGLFGLGATTVDLDEIPELLPGSSIEQSVDVDGVAPFFFTTADIAVGGDVVQRPGAPIGDAAVVAVAAATASTLTIPWTALAIVVLVAGIIVWWLIARRRSKSKQQKAVDDAVAAALAARDGAPIAEASPAGEASTIAEEPAEPRPTA